MVQNLVLIQSTKTCEGIIWASINITFDINWQRGDHYNSLIWSWLNISRFTTNSNATHWIASMTEKSNIPLHICWSWIVNLDYRTQCCSNAFLGVGNGNSPLDSLFQGAITDIKHLPYIITARELSGGMVVLHLSLRRHPCNL